MYVILTKLSPTSKVVFRLNHYFVTNICPNMHNILKPPERVRGITELDKKLFEKEIQITCLTVIEIKVSQILPAVKKYLLKIENFKPIQHDGDEVNIFFNPEHVTAWSSLPVEVQNSLNDLKVNDSNLKNKDFTLTYENFTAEDVLKAVLPTEKEGSSSFTKVGHIVHVNLREHLLPYKNVIGEVLFDKIHGCKSVVNKVNIIDNTYRNFKMEVLKGSGDMLTTVNENGCRFKFDFSKVYWNSRLCTEHERIVKKLQAGDVLFDLFAGVGPFALPAAKKQCYVYANDLNPESFKWLNYNAKANKIDCTYFESFNKDGADFIRQDIKKILPIHLENKKNIYIVMNLPALAVKFLNAFVGLLEEKDLPESLNPPIILVYCFAKGEDYVTIAKKLVVENFGFNVNDKIMEVFRVRTVSSLKEMMRVAIQLDRDILLGNYCKKRKLDDSLELENKKANVGGEFVSFCFAL